MITIDTSSDFHYKNSVTFEKSNSHYPSITTTVNKDMNSQDMDSKIRSKNKRVQDEENVASINMTNIRKYFDPTINQILLNPQERILKNEKWAIVFWTYQALPLYVID
jgi:hypothetical protein